ncbi:AAA family ATPase [Chitinophaga nivalis]|uniref:AAA family ATPase n=1 Tax=Chitinophaga nivalis TaxID=2991709 RepID=A0ABT3IIP1_9BACT|nr:AAA family ATPase [Chitinophaga nivalis]MCW3466639.1 AAA family ATPase [Chitinophaga nivalis]MCW3483670.1 AAA family ATPase [Chitinophaga nivalis]
MKILSIRINNLASLDNVTEIDFTREPLSSAGIFAITGPTGAGKSTILDALCLALYGKTPRYNQARESGIEVHDVQGSTISQGDTRGILRDGTAEGYAEVDFIGVDNQHYRATWRVKRAHGKVAGSLQPFNMALKNISTDTDVPGKKTELLLEIERLVGLSFEQFTRAALLAQGDFTAFLKAGKDEKSSLLEKLTGTGIYSDISRRIFEKHREAAQVLKTLEEKRKDIPTLTTEELDALTAQKAALDESIPLQEKQLEILNNEIAWHATSTALQSSLEAAQQVHRDAITAKNEAAPREQQLKQTDQVQPARKWVDAQHTAQQQLQSKTDLLTKLEQTLLTLQTQEKELTSQVETAQSTLESATGALDAAQPQLDEAKALDVQVKERAAQVQQAKATVATLTTAHQEQEKKLQANQETAGKVSENIAQLIKWKEQHAARQPVADNHLLITSKLSDAATLLGNLQTVAAQIKTVQEKIAANKQEQAKLALESASKQQALETAKETHQANASTLAAIPIATLEQDKSKTDTVIEDIIRAAAHWQLLEHDSKAYHAAIATLNKDATLLGSQQQELIQTMDLLKTAKTKRDTSARIVEKARLAAAENVESLRAQLQPEEPCPVCGSKEHPYVTHNPQLDRVLEELEAIYLEDETTFNKYFTAHTTLDTTCKQLTASIRNQETDLQKKEAALKGLQQTWKTFTIYQEATSIPEDQKSSWLQQQLEQQRTLHRQLQQQVQDHATLKQKVELQKEQVEQADKALTDITNTIKDAARTLLSLQEQEAGYTHEQEVASNNLTAITAAISTYFTASNWQEQWQADPTSFTQRISDFAAQWKSQHDKLDENTRQQGILSATEQAIQAQLQLSATEVEKKKNDQAALTKDHEGLLSRRKNIFGGATVSTVETSLKQAIETARQTATAYQETQQKLQTDITRITTRKEEGDKDIATHQVEIKEFTEKIEQWLLQYNTQHTPTLTHSELLQLLSHTPEWIDAERTFLQQIANAVTQAQSVRSERETGLNKHIALRLSDRQPEELTTLLTAAREQLKADDKENHQIVFRLQEDKNNKEKIGHLLTSIEKQGLITENWAALNDILGSSDGKKFRQVAQEYTLDVLLRYANMHLENLNKRYVLQRIPDTLGLQVLDQDMGNEIRTVYSLSGGESFLVSLALALGLASLSSSRMQVESLFIDEGFGSLDAATLAMAMDTLERLQNQGRKVGVISHVQEMTERIPVQVKVSKHASGKSKVQVVDFCMD